MKKMISYKFVDLILVLIIILIFLFVALLLYFNSKNTLANCVEANKTFEKQNTFLIHHISNNLSVINLENRKISFYTVNGEKIELDKAIFETKIILKYPEMSCDCFDNILNSIVKLPKAIRNRLIIIVPKNRFRYYHSLFSDFELHDIVILGSEDALKISDLDNGIIPYFFILDEDLICKNFFLPISNHDEMLDLYLQYVQKIAFN